MGRDKLGDWDEHVLCIKLMTSEDLLYSTGNATQYSVMSYVGKESKKEGVCVCVYN